MDKDYDTGMFYIKLEKYNDAIQYFKNSDHPDAQNQLEIIRKIIYIKIRKESLKTYGF